MPLPCATMSDQAPRWEYKTVKVKTKSRKALDKLLSKHAPDGWELDRIESGGLIFGTTDTAVLRRPAR